MNGASVSKKGEPGLKIVADTSLLQIAAFPFSDEQLVPPEYRIDLCEGTATFVYIGYKTLGVASNSCILTQMQGTPIPPAN